MKFDHRAARNVTLLILLLSVVFVLFYALNLRINLSKSHVDVGIWRTLPLIDLNVGDVIIYDKDEFFSVYPHVREDRMRFVASAVIKRVAAMSGALIELSGDQVMIDGRLYTEARILYDSWRKVEYPLSVPEGTVWLMADSERAYDSRYHGPVPLCVIREKLEPVFIW
jgi:type IV secretory pathway protease TraF